MRLGSALRNPLVRIVLASLVMAGLLTAAWRYTPLADILTAERVLGWVESLSTYWWTPFVLAFAYTPSSVVMFPRPLLTLAAVVAFGPWTGFAVALGGILMSTLVLYAMGRSMARDKVERLGGPRLARIGKMLRKEGLLAVATVGLLPVAPFAVEALRLKLRHVLPGVTLAMLPGTLGTILLGDQIAAALAQDRAINRWVVVAVVAAMAALAWCTRRWWQRLQAAAA